MNICKCQKGILEEIICMFENGDSILNKRIAKIFKTLKKELEKPCTCQEKKDPVYAFPNVDGLIFVPETEKDKKEKENYENVVRNATLMLEENSSVLILRDKEGKFYYADYPKLDASFKVVSKEEPKKECEHKICIKYPLQKNIPLDKVDFFLYCCTNPKCGLVTCIDPNK